MPQLSPSSGLMIMVSVLLTIIILSFSISLSNNYPINF
uniref:ATP synthase F0 subunit 8 n=1 Tax=Gyraulus sp. GE1 TaxID=2880038 RepID=A0A976QLU4_9GAST|nr:ATP synthase F0 subunit 8 [Gyraulus sp. GE1]